MRLLIGRALYLPEGSAADEEHRELAGVPEKVLFATRPQLAGNLLDSTHRLGIRAAFVAATRWADYRAGFNPVHAQAWLS